MIGVIDVGGGNRGAFGAGVLDYCLDKGIQFDYCIGVSAGSANCVSYIAGQKGRNLRFYTNYNISKDAISIRNRLKYHSMLNLDFIFRTVSNEDGEDPLNYDAFVRSGQALRIVATDAETGRPVAFSVFFITSKKALGFSAMRLRKASIAAGLGCHQIRP